MECDVRELQVRIRYGWHAMVGNFNLPANTDIQADQPAASVFRRNKRIVIETDRGIEIGQCLSMIQASPEPAGRILRSMMPEDELLDSHLRRLSQLAHKRCTDWLNEHYPQAVLLEVEPLLDGTTLYFHFLSDVDDSVEQYLGELVRLYEDEVAASEFAKRVEAGCGPGCGTDKARGKACATVGGCTNCSVKCSKSMS